MGILVERMSRGSAKISRKGWTDRQVVSVLDWDINDAFNDGDTTQEVNWHASHDAG